MTEEKKTRPGEGRSSTKENSRRETVLANLAQLVLDIAREVNLRIEATDELMHLTPSEISVMRYIEGHPGTLPRDAALDVGLQRSNMSVLLRGLCAKSLISIIPDNEDGRKIRLFPTAEALKTLDRHRTRWASFLTDTNCDQAKLSNCVDALSRVNETLLATRRKRSARPAE